MTELVKVYNDGNVELNVEFSVIEGQVYANANTMADSQKLADWKRSANTKRYIDALETRGNSHSLILSGEGRKGGTWIHEKLVLNFARYISVDFELWCDDMIAILIRDGEVSLKQDSYMITDPKERALRWVEEYEEKQKLELEVKEKQEVIKAQAPKVEYYEKVLDTTIKRYKIA